MMEFTIKTKPGCKWCKKAKRLMDSRRFKYTEIEYLTEEDFKRFKEVEGYSSWPQIYVSGAHIGGYDAFEEFVVNLG